MLVTGPTAEAASPLCSPPSSKPRPLHPRLSLTAGLSPLMFMIKSEIKLRAERATQSPSHKFSCFGKSATTIFERSKLDIVMIDVRMGGRLDATAMIPDKAVVSALASINFSHRGSLGNTVTGLRELGDDGDCEERKTVRVGETEVPRASEGPYWNISGYLIRCRAH